MASNKTNQLIKAAALVGLVFQNTSLILFMKQASLTPSEGTIISVSSQGLISFSDGKKALTTTVVVMVMLDMASYCKPDANMVVGGALQNYCLYPGDCIPQAQKRWIDK